MAKGRRSRGRRPAACRKIVTTHLDAPAPGTRRASAGRRAWREGCKAGPGSKPETMHFDREDQLAKQKLSDRVAERSRQMEVRVLAATKARRSAERRGRRRPATGDRQTAKYFWLDDQPSRDMRGFARQQAYYRRLGPTKEWAENNYYQLPIEQQNAELITINAFWRDFAAWVAEGSKAPFLSPHVAEASRNFHRDDARAGRPRSALRRRQAHDENRGRQPSRSPPRAR